MTYSQRDPQWKSKRLGFGTGTIGMYGCKVTSLAQGLLRFGFTYNPQTMNDLLKEYGLYVGSTKNLMDDSSITRLPFIESFKRVDRWSGDMTELSNLLKSHVVIGEVSPIPIGGTGQHFVGIDSVDGKNAVITDPWFGDKRRVADRYNKYGNILGLRIYQVKSTIGQMPEKYPYGIDLNNPESVKVCVETWKQVIDGEYVKLDVHQETVEELSDKLKAETEALNDSKDKFDRFVERCASLVGAPNDEESLVKFLSNFDQTLARLDEYKTKYEKQTKKLSDERLAYETEIDNLLDRITIMEEKHAKQIKQLKEEIGDLKDKMENTDKEDARVSEMQKIFNLFSSFISKIRR